MVYADSPHIHLLQSVANQSKVRVETTRMENTVNLNSNCSLHVHILQIAIEVSW